MVVVDLFSCTARMSVQIARQVPDFSSAGIAAFSRIDYPIKQVIEWSIKEEMLEHLLETVKE